MHPLVLYKSILKKFMLIDNYCKDCGRKAEAWHTSDFVWETVRGYNGNNELCIHCFVVRASQTSLRSFTIYLN